MSEYTATTNLIKEDENNQVLEFDEIISLGYNCQIAFGAEAIFGGIDSNLFNWVAVFDVKNMLKVFENPDLLLSKGITYFPERGIWIDNLLGFGYHTKTHTKILKKGDKDILEKDEKEVLSRFNYLREKFLKKCKSDTKKLYVHYFQEEIPREDANEVVQKFSDFVKNISGNKDSRLLILFKKSYFENANINKPDNVIIQFVPEEHFFAGVCDIKFDTWMEVFKNYRFTCYENPNFKKNYKKFRIKRKLERKFYQKLFFVGNKDGYKYLYIFNIKIKLKKL